MIFRGLNFARNADIGQISHFWMDTIGEEVVQIMTFDQLRRKREADLTGAEGAVLRHNDTYLEIKQLVRDINSCPLDVADYHRTARRLGALLHELSDGIDKTIFHYYAEHIDPGKSGDVRCFRMECEALSRQIREIDQWRAARHRIKRVK